MLLLRLLCCCEYLKNSHISSKSKGDLFGGNVLYGLYSTGGGVGGLVLSFNHNSLHTIPNLSLCSYKPECIKHIFLTMPSISDFHVLTTLYQTTSFTFFACDNWSSEVNRSPVLLLLKKCVLFLYRKVSIRKQFFTGFDIKKSRRWLHIFYVSPCKKPFSYLYLSIFEHNFENK